MDRCSESQKTGNQPAPKYKYIFGPVPSRRLGRSLGVDLVPAKTCSFDCVYCQIGRTSMHATLRKQYVPFEQVLRELVEALAGPVRPDYVTLSGSGEPTLYSRLGELIDAVGGICDIPVAVITNASLFSDPQVRYECNKAYLVLPSLDAGDQALFMKINRPAEGIVFDQFIDGLKQFCLERTCKVWLEVFVLAGINDTPEQMQRIRSITEQLNVDRVQLNTAIRPAAEDYALAVDAELLCKLAGMFDPAAEVIAEFPHDQSIAGDLADAQAILQMLRRRPCRVQDISAGLAVSLPCAVKMLDCLKEAGKVRSVRRAGQVYYVANKD